MPADDMDRRKSKRYSCRLPMRYEKTSEAEAKGLTVSTLIRDINCLGVSFYSFEVIKLDSLINVFFYITDKDFISFIASVKWIEISNDEELGKYIVGAEIEKIEESMKQVLVDFLSFVDIEAILEKINLKNILDLNFVGGYPPMVKQCDKVLMTDCESLSKEVVQGLLLSILDDGQYKTFMEEKELNFIYPYKDLRFRVNLHFQQGNVEGTFRMIPHEIKQLLELGVSSAVESLLSSGKKGLILITGRTGSGKTTTLASMVEHINNSREGIIVCIEDPIEYVHKNKKCIIKQREVGRDTVSFSAAAKNALRQNPNVLVIGEILDMDTMEVALTMAESGTLILASFHAPNSMYALDRIVSLFPADLHSHILGRLSLTLMGIITQELLPRADNNGSVLATEVLIVNDALRRIIRHGDWKQIPTVLQTGRGGGMQSMEDSLKYLYEQGIIEGEYLKEFY